MTNITHDLILTPILRLQIAQGATGEGKPMVDLLCELGILANLPGAIEACRDLIGV